MKRLLTGMLSIAAIAGLFWLGAKHEAPSDALPQLSAQATASDQGAAYFIGGDFSGLSLATLESHALPWKLVMAAFVLHERRLDPSLPADLSTAQKTLARFGFLTDAVVANRPDAVFERSKDLPLGVSHGALSPVMGAPVQVANLGCASCHAGVTYDAAGLPQPDQAWIGMPNTSLNLEAYTVTIFRALREHDGPVALFDMVDQLYPDLGWRERVTLRLIVYPLVKKRLSDIDGDSPLPFPNGFPGGTNGVAALKHVLGVPFHGDGMTDAGFVSIPDLGHRHWRSSLLADGAYSVPGVDTTAPTSIDDDTPEKRKALAAITTFFSVPSMGVHPDKTVDAIPVAEDIFDFLAEDYVPQPFPAAINIIRAAEGREIYQRMCSNCHGTYTEEGGRPVLQSYPNWIGDVGTDPLRGDAFTPQLAAKIAETPYDDLIFVTLGQGYAAPPLSGVWASAPYLHNGSVPTIWHLLTPDARPAFFPIGGHALDFTRLGLRLEEADYPEGYRRFADFWVYGTRDLGKGNEGHTFGATLSEAEKMALIEYLKQL